MTALPPATDPLIDLRTALPAAIFDIRYATAANPTGEPLYPFPGAFLRRSTAAKLVEAAAALKDRGFLLVVYDAYRPLSAQKALWKAKPDPRFVADPRKGSSHNKGAAVDLGLASLDGRALEMPSAFDEFGPRARHGAPGVPAEARARAEALKAAMTAAGFEPLEDEWWHYRDRAAKDWPVLDVPFGELAQ